MKGKLLLVGSIGLGISLLLGSVVFFVSRAGARLTSSQPAAEEVKHLPNFFLPDLSGELHGSSELTGEPAVVNFWATWCRPCEEEMPLLRSYAEKYPQVRFIGVNSGEETAVVEPFIDKYDITFSIWLDADTEVSDKMQIVGLPTTYFIDATGAIQAVHLGQLSAELLDKYLLRLGIEP